MLGVFSRINFFATHPTCKRAREEKEATHLHCALLLSVWRRPCPNISCRSWELLEDSLREMCRPACEMNLRKKTVDPQARAPSTVSSNWKTSENIAFHLQSSSRRLTSLNSAPADFHKPEPEDAMVGEGDNVIEHVGNLFTDALCGNSRAVGNVFWWSGDHLTCAS